MESRDKDANAQRSSMIDVGIADSNPLMLGALSERFERDPRFNLVATSGTAEGFLEVIFRADIAVGIIDWNLPVLGAQRLLEILLAQETGPRIVVYSQDEVLEIPRRALAAGAAGFCSRDESVMRLMDVVVEVAAGRMVFPFLDVRELRQDPMDTLTEREQAMIALLARGMSNKELSSELGISLNTVKFHLRNMFEKLSVNSRTQAIAMYYSKNRSAT